MAYFSFRAECEHDVAQFKTACESAGITLSLDQHPDGDFPDVEVELEASVSLELLRNVMRGMVDSHVMLQTLRQCRLKDNNLERDLDLE